MNPYIAALAIFAIVVRAKLHNSLTNLGLLFGVLTAIAHAYHPWSVFFVFLAVFFVAGSKVTKIGHDKKKDITQQAGTTTSEEPPRTHIQVLANSFVATIVILTHARYLRTMPESSAHPGSAGLVRVGSEHFHPLDTLPYVAAAIYAAVTADTFSSELGILSVTEPFLSTDVLGILGGNPRRVPRGTNGAISFKGLQAGLLGSLIISLAALWVPLAKETNAPWTIRFVVIALLVTVAAGFSGTLIDSWLGAIVQETVRSRENGRVVEAPGGGRVLRARNRNERRAEARARARARTGQDPNTQAAEVQVPHEPDVDDHEVVAGWDLLTNNGVNFAMTICVMMLSFSAITFWASLYPGFDLAAWTEFYYWYEKVHSWLTRSTFAYFVFFVGRRIERIQDLRQD